MRGLWVFVALIPSLLQGESPIKFEHLSLEQGISHNLVYCMTQDSVGLLWFGTLYGLVKYDGLSSTVYRHDPDDQNTLSNDDITCLFEDRRRNLWVGTYGGGVNNYDRTNGTITRYVSVKSGSETIDLGIVLSVCEDSDGRIWIGTNANGACVYDPIRSTFSFFRHSAGDSTSLSNNCIVTIHKDAAGSMWLGTRGGGLNRYESGMRGFKHYRNIEADSTSLASNYVRSLYTERSGTLWVGTLGGGLCKYSRKTDSFVRIHHDYRDTQSAHLNSVNAILQDIEGKMWIGTPGGLTIFDSSQNTFTHYAHDPADPSSISSDEVVALMQDRSGVVWVGTYRGGLDKYSATKRKFRHVQHNLLVPHSLSNNLVRVVYEDRAGSLWVGTDGGLDRFDDDRNTFRHYEFISGDDAIARSNAVTAIDENHQGKLFIGTLQGLFTLDQDRSTSKHYRHDASNPLTLASDNVNEICCDKAGDVWIGTPAGLDRWSPGRETFVHYVNDPGNRASLPNNFVMSMYEDHTGSLWVGTWGGLGRLDSKRKGFDRFKQDPDDPQGLSNNYCLAMTEDEAGSLWIGTGGGLNRFDRSTGKFHHLGTKDGMPNGVICGIVNVAPGILWLSTNRGLSRFDAMTRTFSNFDISNGLQSNMFFPGSYCKRRNGDIVFGGINGFNIIDSSTPPRNSYVPPVIITSFMLFDNMNSDLARTRSYFTSVTLSHTENFFALAFAALDYTHPERNQYAFKLDGFDDEWVTGGNRRFARYMNLDPGEYVFRVKGSNNDGVWNERGSELHITILPPFWKTWWFYSISAVAFFGSLAAFYNHRVKEKVRRLTELERVRDEENKKVRKRAADDFHDEFGHKLTKISLLGQVMKRTTNGGSSELTEHLTKIIQTSNELSMGMRDFLWTLNPDKDSAYDVAIRLKDFGDELFNSTGIGFRVASLSKDLETVRPGIDWRRHVTLMFKEAMNNAAKHSACRNVSLEIAVKNELVEIRLADDGKGFDVGRSTAGQGLYSMQHRAEKIHGTLNIASQHDKGTIVEFIGEAPVDPAAKQGGATR